MSRMKKITAAVCLSAVVLVLLPALLALISAPIQPRLDTAPPTGVRSENNAVFADSAPTASPAQDKLYILREIDGQIGVFDADNTDSPIFITDTPTQTLRLSDRALIRQGISVFGYENMLKLLEDFGS